MRAWIRQAEIDEGKGPPERYSRRPEREELSALKREVKTLRLEREILKAAAFFAKEST